MLKDRMMKPIFDINGYLVDKLAFSNGLWLLIASIAFALLCVCFVFAVGRGRLKARQMFVETAWVALWYYGFLALSLITLFPKEKPLWQPANPLPVWCGAAAVAFLGFLLYFFKRKKHFIQMSSATAIRKSAAASGAARFCYALLFSAMLVSAVICGIRIAMGDSIFHLLFPMLLVALALLPCHRGLRFSDDPERAGRHQFRLLPAGGDDSAAAGRHPSAAESFGQQIPLGHVRRYPSLQ